MVQDYIKKGHANGLDWPRHLPSVEMSSEILYALTMDDSPTIKSMEALQATIDALKVSGIDPVFILAALAQVTHDMTEEGLVDVR